MPGGTANWTFAGGTNYRTRGRCHDRHHQADATCSVSGYYGTYDAGPAGLQSPPSPVTTPAARTSARASISATRSPTCPAGPRLDVRGGTNYEDEAGDVTIAINKADASFAVNGYTGAYDAAAHGATGSATGVDAGGAALGSS